MSVGVPFSKSTVLKIYQQIMCRFRMNGKPIGHIFRHFKNMLASCECRLKEICSSRNQSRADRTENQNSSSVSGKRFLFVGKNSGFLGLIRL